ncbi:signal recognition particle protein [Buchnera aphidicola]|uniref:signal recognition particle protein n=1 Tax=Buchnera aphidicola TaxID=9 RepID=UPI002238B265|nr:signal recognition particle protein [Buchnera aphidicola]MCW5197568.1 signal recognition particle protein [Buchnera aphidicola (Chaitophorus viminalis)]
MFKNLTKCFTKIIKNISHRGRITEQNIKETLREIRITLLEADVSFIVIKKFIKKIKKKCIGEVINNSLTPGQEFVKIVKKELIKIIGNKNSSIKFLSKKLSVFLVIGLQGAGKTTSIGKLSNFFQKKFKKKVLVTSTDIYRPAAIKQLKIISSKIQVDVFKSHNSETPIDISKKAIEYAKIKKYDILIIDTAGRLHVNKKLMHELQSLNKYIQPTETIFVIDSMIGQDSINIIKNFQKHIFITSIFLTKLDSNTRCGVALSIKYLTEIPIKFIGNGEKIDNIELFNAKKISSKILGMENILSEIKSIKKKFGKKNINKLNTQIKKYNSFNLNDFLKQIYQIKKIGSIKFLLQKLPISSNIKNNILFQMNDSMILKIESIIKSMTIKERNYPNIIKISRKKRIALGSGTTIQDVNKLLKQFKSIKKIMKKIKNIGFIKFFNKIKQMIL